MSKVAAYLQEHIQGEVTTNAAILDAKSRDMSVLRIAPEMVIYPRVTNDIRKVARFSWQLAEKGHVLPITVRGGGNDQTGAAIGKGIALVTTAHMNRVFELAPKQKLVRVQPGVSISALSTALSLHGMGIPPLMGEASGHTIGGMIGNNSGAYLSGKYGKVGSWIHQMEVVLANGDVLQTGRISKRELSKKKGQQDFEGEIYRSLDNLIEDNSELIENSIAGGAIGNVGYAAIADVKQKDGSFDLAPLIAGSQGTLGIVSEMIMRVEFVSSHMTVALLAFSGREQARDALDGLKSFEPAILEMYDGELFNMAAEQGKIYEFYKELNGNVGSVILIGFDDFSDRARQKHVKKVARLLKDTDAFMVTGDGDEAEELLTIRGVMASLFNPAGKDVSAPPLFDNAYIPSERYEDFAAAVRALGEKHHVSLPLAGKILEDTYTTRPQLHLHKVGDKQKVFKLLDEYGAIVAAHNGYLIGADGEGRVKAPFAHKQLDDDIKALFEAIKNVFDPHGILNPGVKQAAELRSLVSALRTDYDIAASSDYASYN
ncbi:MAG TPA: FAD-binding oxidoreductase [Candidatus Saccharimonadales bacterium]